MAIQKVDEHTPALVRRAAAAMLDNWGCGSVAGHISLAVTELLATSATTWGGRCTVRLEFDRPIVRLAVRDISPKIPEIPTVPPDFDAESGRGLWVVAAICDSFYFERLDFYFERLDGEGGTGVGKSAVAELRAV